MNIVAILSAIPATYDLYPALLIIACKIVTIFVRPPAATSPWASVYSIVNALALNIGWAANRLQVGKTGLMIRDAEIQKAGDALTHAGITGFKPESATRATATAA